MLERYKVILASQSPRRRELLQRILKNFDVVESDLCEEGFPEEEGKDLTVVLAENKAKNVKDRLMAEAPEETDLMARSWGNLRIPQKHKTRSICWKEDPTRSLPAFPS